MFKIDNQKVLAAAKAIGISDQDTLTAIAISTPEQFLALLTKRDLDALTRAMTPGPPGNPGKDGINGTNGVNGTPGSNAASPVFTTAVTTLAAGSQATVTLTGTYPNLKLTIGVPSGAAGANGTNGTNGTNGLQGPPGPSTILSGKGTLPAQSLLTANAVRSITIAVAGVTVGTPCIASFVDGAAINLNTLLNARCATAGVVTVEQIASVSVGALPARDVNVRAFL